MWLGHEWAQMDDEVYVVVSLRANSRNSRRSFWYRMARMKRIGAARNETIRAHPLTFVFIRVNREAGV